METQINQHQLGWVTSIFKRLLFSFQKLTWSAKLNPHIQSGTTGAFTVTNCHLVAKILLSASWQFSAKDISTLLRTRAFGSKAPVWIITLRSHWFHWEFLAFIPEKPPGNVYCSGLLIHTGMILPCFSDLLSSKHCFSCMFTCDNLNFCITLARYLVRGVQEPFQYILQLENIDLCQNWKSFVACLRGDLSTVLKPKAKQRKQYDTFSSQLPTKGRLHSCLFSG